MLGSHIFTLKVQNLSVIWNVVFEGPTKGVADDFALQFIDVKEIFGNYVGFETQVFRDIVANIQKFDHYFAVSNIKEVKSPEDEDLSDRPVVALLGIDKNNLKFGMLLFVGENDTIILGLWPQPFFDAVKDDENVLAGTLVAFLKVPDNWQRVDLILSTSVVEGEESEESE